jgi:hypothetical protein
MKTNAKTKMEITLTLTAEEAIWLKGLVQNAQCDPSEESAENAAMRAAMFDALPSFEELYRSNTHDQERKSPASDGFN